MNMKNDKIWVDNFYQKITTEKNDLLQWIGILGNTINTNIAGNIKNTFIVPYDTRFKSIYIASDISGNIIHRIGFIGGDFCIPFLYCEKYASSYTKQFIIYDEKVEFVFFTKSNQNIIRSIACSTEEYALNYTRKEEEKIKFNNISFVFKQ